MSQIEYCKISYKGLPNSIVTERVRDNYAQAYIEEFMQNTKLDSFDCLPEIAAESYKNKISLLTFMAGKSCEKITVSNQILVSFDALYFSLTKLAEMGHPFFAWSYARFAQTNLHDKKLNRVLYSIAANRGCAASHYQLSFVEKERGNERRAKLFVVNAANLGHPFSAYQTAMEIDRGRLYQQISLPKRRALMAHFLSIALTNPADDGTTDVSRKAAKKLGTLLQKLDKMGDSALPKNPVLITNARSKLHDYVVKNSPKGA